jgi:hypothetical protein
LNRLAVGFDQAVVATAENRGQEIGHTKMRVPLPNGGCFKAPAWVQTPPPKTILDQRKSLQDKNGILLATSVAWP